MGDCYIYIAIYCKSSCTDRVIFSPHFGCKYGALLQPYILNVGIVMDFCFLLSQTWIWPIYAPIYK